MGIVVFRSASSKDLIVQVNFKMAIITALVFSFCVAACRAELFEGDIKLDPETASVVDGVNTFDAVVSERRKWPGARVPYIFASNYDAKRKAAVKEAIAEYNKYTCIRFVPRKNERNYIKFIIDDGCWSYIGMTGGEQSISIGNGCVYKGTIMHEMMHASGFWHEQSRLDRDKYVKIHWENVKGGKSNNNFQKYSHGQADYYGEGYDFDSVMHYGNWYFSKNGKMTIEAVNDPYKIVGQRTQFSPTDVKQLNKVYKCRGYENVKVPALPGCIDTLSRCPSYANGGYCKTSQRYMLKNCCKSCKNLREGGSGSICVDKNSNCPKYQRAGYCTKYQSWMNQNCQKSCKKC